MRRYAFLLMLLLPAAGAFALDLGFGVSGGYLLNENITSLASPAVSSETRFTHVPLGASVYADFDYFILSVGYTQLILSHEVQTVSGSTTPLVDADTGTGGYVSVALMGKYSFSLGALTLSPLLGLGFDINVLLLDTAGNDLRLSMSDQQKSELEQLWVRTGAALDVAFTPSVYLRSVLVCGIKLPTSGELSAYWAATQAGFNVVLFVIKPEFSASIGFKL
jgi:hypothetical protein